jgi:hypothetical protein
MIRFLFILFGLIPLFGAAQTIPNSFKLTNNLHTEKEAFYVASIEKADMEKYRLKDKEVTLKFENGFECTLFSAKELFMNGRSINAASYEESFPRRFMLPVFTILESGQLMARYQNMGKLAKK